MATTSLPARQVAAADVPQSLAVRLKYFLNPLDGRYEDLFHGDWRPKVFGALPPGSW